MDASEFLHYLFDDCWDGWLEITYLANTESKIYPKTIIQWKELPIGYIDPNIPTIRALNEKGYNVYFGVAVRKNKKDPHSVVNEKTGRTYTAYPRGTEKDSSYITALWVDIDDVKDEADERYQRLLNMNPMVSIIVKSGGGYHGYFRLSSPLKITEDNINNVKRTLKGLAIAVGADPKVAELARIMRLPTTINTKPKHHGAICEVIDYIPAGGYDYYEIEATYSRLAGPKELPITRDVPIEASAGLKQWVLDYLDNGAQVGGRNRKLYAAAMEYKANGLSEEKALSELGERGLRDGLTTDEVHKTIKYAFKREKGKVNISPESEAKMKVRDNQRGKRKF